METKTKRTLTVATSIAAVGAIIGGVYLVGQTASLAEAPNPTPVVVVETDPTVTPLPMPTAEPTVEPTAEPVVPEPVEPAPVPVEPAPVAPLAPPAPPAPAPAPAPVEPSPPPVAVLCPAGSAAIDSDGFNDIWCMWELCLSLTLPDPEHPECDGPFRP